MPEKSLLLEFVSSQDSDELRALARSAQKFMTGLTRHEKFERDTFNRMGELGFTGASISEAHGGSGLDALSIAGLIFEMARGQLGPAVYLSVHLMVGRLIERWGKRFDADLAALASGKKLGAFCLTEAHAGSDAAALRTRAERANGGYRLSGEKIYITSGGVADLYLVFARTAEDKKKGISTFLIERGTPGLSFGPPEKKMGCEGSPITTVALENVEVPDSARVGVEGEGYKIALSALAGGRVNMAACACGIASRSLDLATAHASTREQFGQRIAEFQGIQVMLADMAIKLRASVLLTRDAAQSLARGESENASAAIAKCFATDSAMAVTTDGVQICGGAGYLRDYLVEQLMRDAKMLQIVEGTNQIQRGIIARALLSE